MHIVTVSEDLVSQNRDFWICAALPLFYSLFRVKNHHCIVLHIRKLSKNGKRLVAYRYSLRRACFAKYRFPNLHILPFRCFIPCLGYRRKESDCCDSGYVHFSTCFFISFRFVSQNTVSLSNLRHPSYPDMDPHEFRPVQFNIDRGWKNNIFPLIQ